MEARSEERFAALRWMAMRERLDLFGVTTPVDPDSFSSSPSDPRNDVRSDAPFRTLAVGRFTAVSVLTSCQHCSRTMMLRQNVNG